MSVAYFVAQWVPAATVKDAEEAFYKINDSATPLDPTEKRIIKFRNTAPAIAARAIAHGGQGFAYWKDFSDETQDEIVKVSTEIYAQLYTPPLSGAHIDTLDVPVAGKGYSILPFVFDLVTKVNNVKVADSTGKGKKESYPPDTDGENTKQYLREVKKAVSRITGKGASSLCLHPVVYFYSGGGVFSPWAFLAWLEVIEGVVGSRHLIEFCDARQELEKYLISNKWLVTEIVHRNGSGSRSIPWLAKYYRFILEKFLAGASADDVLSAVQVSDEFKRVAVRTPVDRLQGPNSRGRISSATRTGAIWGAALPGAPRCYLCGGLWHRNSIHGEHKLPLRSGGDGRPANVGIAHPYCDSTYKDFAANRARRAASDESP